MSEIEEIVDAFEFLDDWDARYQYLIELGESMEVMPPARKCEANWIKPCMSTVHVDAEPVPGEPTIRFRGEPGEQAILLLLGPSGNALEFKAFRDIDAHLFAR